MKRILLYILSVLFICSSCERPIDYKGKITEPKLVLQAEAGAGDQTVKAYVSRSRFFLDETYDKKVDYTMPDAVTEFQRGDQEWQTMVWSTEEKAFVLSLGSPLKAGETLRLKSSHPDYETITAEQTTVPAPFCQLLYYNGQNKVLYWNKSQHYVELTLILQNYPYEEQMLGLSVNFQYDHQYLVGKRKETKLNQKSNTIASTDQLFATGGNTYINGQGFCSNKELFFAPGYQNAYLVDIRLYYDVPYGLTEELNLLITELNISFKAHNKDSYWYWKSMLAARDGRDDESGMLDVGAVITDLLGQEEAVQIYSNIQNGYGIFGACSKYIIQAEKIEAQ